MPIKRDDKGRFKTKGPEPREKVIRVTNREYNAINEARKKGLDPRKVLLEKATQGNAKD